MSHKHTDSGDIILYEDNNKRAYSRFIAVLEQTVAE